MLTKDKRGYAFRVISGIIGSSCFLGALILIEKGFTIYGGFAALIGVILISISFLPLIKG